MLKKTVLATVLAAAFGAPLNAYATSAADNHALAQIRDEIAQMKKTYETRIEALEKRLQQAEEKAANSAPPESVAAPETAAPETAAPEPVAVAAPAGGAGNAFNPAISMILGGTYANLSQDPAQYRIQGFIPAGDEVGPGKRGFTLGESELTLSANVDPDFSGKLTFSLTPENTVSVEEAFAETSGLSHGVGFKVGRFLSSVGYLNSQHAHAWDFVDAPLAYQAFFGGQHKPDGLQLRWLAPTDRFVELGLEAGSSDQHNGFGSTALFAHMGDDLGDSLSWRAGASYLHARAADRSYDDLDNGIVNAFSGRSNLWLADGIIKWAPNGNATRTNFKLQGEYFRRRENGTLAYDAQSPAALSDRYASAQSGWYLQGVYQFAPMWRVGLRHDSLDSGTPSIGLIGSSALSAADFPALAAWRPTRNTLMLDYSPSEFSRLRLQFARDKARADAVDNHFFIHYIMSLGTHGAHSF